MDPLNETVSCEYDPDSWSFCVRQEGLTGFVVPEGYMQRLVDAFLDPDDFDFSMSLWGTLRVTEESQSIILSSSSAGNAKLLIRLSKKAAKEWAEQVEAAHGAVIRSYAC